jgi:hypothetical protein
MRYRGRRGPCQASRPRRHPAFHASFIETLLAASPGQQLVPAGDGLEIVRTLPHETLRRRRARRAGTGLTSFYLTGLSVGGISLWR